MAVLDREGRVVVAKFGATVGKSALQTLQNRIDQDGAATIYLASSETARVWAFRVVGAAHGLPRDWKHLTPAYYRPSDIADSFLVEDIDELPPSEVSRLEVASSGNPIADALARSQSGMFWVRRR